MKEILPELTRMGLLSSPSPDVYKTWAHHLADLSEVAIRIGVAKVRDYTGYFSLPVFRSFCRITGQDLGMPDPHSAYVEACNKSGECKDWTHPAVYWAANQTGWFELRNRTEKEIYPLYKLNYETMVARVIAGERLDMPVQLALPESHTPSFLSAEQNMEKLGRLKGLMGMLAE